MSMQSTVVVHIRFATKSDADRFYQFLSNYEPGEMEIDSSVEDYLDTFDFQNADMRRKRERDLLSLEFDDFDAEQADALSKLVECWSGKIVAKLSLHETGEYEFETPNSSLVDDDAVKGAKRIGMTIP